MENQPQKKQPDKSYIDTDSVASQLVNEMYLTLTDAKPEDLSAEQLIWLKKVENSFGKKKPSKADILYSFLDSAYHYLHKQAKWERKDEKVYEMLEKIIYLKAKDTSFKDFMESLNTTVNSTLALDFTTKAPISNENLDERNILNYIPFALNMIIEKMETSVVSMKAANSMLSASPGSAILVTDTKGNIRFINSIGESLLEINHNEYLGHSINDLFQEHKEIIKRLQGGKSKIKNMKAHLLLKQEKLPVYIDVNETKTDDEIGEIIYSINSKQAVEDEFDRIFDLIQESHDKIAPLNSMSGIIDLLRQQLTDEDSRQLISFLDDSVTRLKINARGTLSDIEKKKKNSKRELVHIEFIFDNIIKSLAFTEGFNEITFIKDIHYQTDLYSDPKLIYSILQNLISNSIKYRKIGLNNKVQLTVRDSSKNQMLIILQDTGIGISPENQIKIFEKNYRDLFSIKGHGAGLYLVKESVAKLGGDMEIISKTGEGSVFIISLPYLP